MGVVQMFNKPVPAGRHELIIPDGSGHSTMTWTPGTADVEDVVQRFEEIVRGQGFTAYAEAPDGELSIIRDFDETATRIVVQAPLVGG